MTFAAFCLFTVAVIVMVGVHAWTMKRLEDRAHTRQQELDAADEGRRTAVYQQQKAAQTEIAKLQRAGEVLADQTRALHEDTRLMQQRTDALLRDARG